MTLRVVEGRKLTWRGQPERGAEWKKYILETK
jgi:hypothetical protein